MKIWIVMATQLYANENSVVAVCDSKEKAEEIKANMGDPDYVFIHESKLNELYPTL